MKISIFLRLIKLNMLNLRLIYRLKNLRHHFSTFLIEADWYTASCKYPDCFGLKAVYLEDIASWCSVNIAEDMESNPISMAHLFYVNGEEVKDLIIPEGVTIINKYVFHDATALTSVVIRSSVTHM